MGNKVSAYLSEERGVDSRSMIDRSVSVHRCVVHRPEPDLSDPELDWYETFIDVRKRLRQEVSALGHHDANVTTSRAFFREEVRYLYTLVELEDSEPGGF